jgi:hypothetical protein
MQDEKKARKILTEIRDTVASAKTTKDTLHESAQELAGIKPAPKSDQDQSLLSKASQAAESMVNLALDYPITSTAGTMLAYQTISGLLGDNEKQLRMQRKNRRNFTTNGLSKLSALLRQSLSDTEKKKVLIRFFKFIFTYPELILFSQDQIISLDALVKETIGDEAEAINLLSAQDRQKHQTLAMKLSQKIDSFKAFFKRQQNDTDSFIRSFWSSVPEEGSLSSDLDPKEFQAQLARHADLFRVYFPFNSSDKNIDID